MAFEIPPQYFTLFFPKSFDNRLLLCRIAPDIGSRLSCLPKMLPCFQNG